MGEMDIVELKIPSRPEYVRVVRLAVSGIASQMSFSVDEIEDIKLAVSEACTNAIEHTSEDKKVEVRCFVEKEKLVIEVSNLGRYFSQEEFEKALGNFTGIWTGEMEKMEPNGLGLIIMRALMDEVEFKPNPGNGTTVRLVKSHATRTPKASGRRG